MLLHWLLLLSVTVSSWNLITIFRLIERERVAGDERIMRGREQDCVISNAFLLVSRARGGESWRRNACGVPKVFHWGREEKSEGRLTSSVTG